MIPLDFIIALTTTSILAVSYFITFKNKIVNITLNTVLCLMCSSAWTAVLYNSYISQLNIETYTSVTLFIQIILSVSFSVVVMCLLMMITWKETPTALDNPVQESNYTPETLLIETGVVVKPGTINNGSLCKLNKTGALAFIYFDEEVKKGDILAVTSIDADRIYGKIIGTTDKLSES